MSPYRRNILVGITVLGAVGLFSWMILRFGTKTVEVFAPPQIPIHFVADRADGLSEGSSITYLGINVGRLTKLARKADGTGVIIDAVVDTSPPLPSNLQADIKQTSAIGGGTILALSTEGPPSKEPLKANATISDTHYIGLDLFGGGGFGDAAKEIAATAAELRKTSQQLRESGVIRDLDTTIRAINQQVGKAGNLLDSMQQTVGDPQMRDDIRTAIANFRQTTDTANRIAAKLEKTSDSFQKITDETSATVADAHAAINKSQGHIDDLSKQLADRLVQMSAVLDSFQDISRKIDQGKGSAGALINDPKLYASLVDSSRELSQTIADLHRLIDQWEQEGVTLKLK